MRKKDFARTLIGTKRNERTVHCYINICNLEIEVKLINHTRRFAFKMHDNQSTRARTRNT